LAKKKRSFRLLVQILWTALTNGFLYGFQTRKIYVGNLKKICLPGLNCYSCPGALGSCPLGALQGVITGWKFDFSFFMVGALMFFGALLGRAICGFLCPFGLVQDLMYKIPFFKKRKSLPFHRALVFLKYAVLIVFVCVLPYVLVTFKTGVPAFCKYICPSGTLMGALALVPGNEALSAQAGGLFQWKVGLLAAFLLLSLYVYRPFCKYFCPLGAIYSLFSRISLVRMKVDEHACVHCGACKKACKMSINPEKNPNSMECIRCGDCIRACPTRAISMDTPLVCRRRKRRRGENGTDTKEKTM